MNSTDPIPVSVAITSVSDDNVFSFTGSGTYSCDGRGVHLHYTVRDREGHTVSSSLHIGAGKALLDNGSYRLLLDPVRPTVSRLAGGDEAGLTVTTHSICDSSALGEGAIELRYTLSALGRFLESMHVTLAIRPMEGYYADDTDRPGAGGEPAPPSLEQGSR